MNFILLGLFSLIISTAQAETQFEHWGGPPRGTAFIKLTTHVSLTPIQILGTLNPPSLALNGKTVLLQPAENVLPGLTVGGKSKNTEGEMGRFFILLSPEETARDVLQVTLKKLHGQAMAASLRLGRSFLDAPLSMTQQIAHEPGTVLAPHFDFEFSGAIPEGHQIEVEKSEVKKENGVNFRWQAPLGKSTLVAKLTSSAGQTRFLNIPVQVEAKTFSESDPVLSLEVPEGQTSGQPWSSSSNGLKIRGVTNSGAKLLLDGREVSVSSDGSFEWTYWPEGDHATDHEVEFSLSLVGQTPKIFHKRILSPDSAESNFSWISPRRPKPSSYFITARLMVLSGGMALDMGGIRTPSLSGGSGNSNAGNQEVPKTDASFGVGPAVGFKVGKYLTPFSAMALKFQGLGASAKSTAGIGPSGTGFEVETRNIQRIAVNYQVLPWSFLSVGAGFYYLGADVKITTRGGFATSEAKYRAQVMGLELLFELRLALSEHWELTPEFTLAPGAFAPKLGDAPIGIGQSWFEPLCLRYRF